MKKNIKNLGRRSFVKTTSLAAGALVTSNLAMASSSVPYFAKKLKLAVVGCGGRGTGAAVQALNADPDVELVAMADAFQDRLESSLKSIADHFGESRKIDVKEKNRFVGFDAFKQAIDQADVVILATPPGFRPQHFEYAVDNNKHIFMEKPVATDVPGVKKVLAAAKKAKENKLNVVVGLQRRYQGNYLAAIKQLRSGALGKIVSGQVYWNSAGVWVKERKPKQTELEYQMRNWYYFNWLCGDHILEQHIHNIDVANWFIDEYPVSAQGMGGRQVRTGKDHGEIFDHHFVEFTYPSGAVVASQCRHQPDTMSRVSEFFQGTQGTISTEGNTTRITDWQGNSILDYREKNDPNPYEEEHVKLFQAIRNGSVIADAEHGAKSTLTAIMGRMATYSGKIITWDEAMASNLELAPQNLSWGSQAPVQPKADGTYNIPMPGKTIVM